VKVTKLLHYYSVHFLVKTYSRRSKPSHFSSDLWS